MKFVQARNYTDTGAAGRRVDLVVVHTMEYPERPTGAEWCADYFAKPDAPRASAHYYVDNDSVIQGVKDEDVAWAAPGNNHNGIQVEHAGYAAQGRKGWADDYSRAMLRLSAELVAQECKKHKIPAVYVDAAGLKAGKRGITTHAQVSRAWGRSDHTDPGPDFPMDAYVQMVQDELENLKAPHPATLPPVAPVALRVNLAVNGRIVNTAQRWENPEFQKRLRRLVERGEMVTIRKVR